MEQIRFNTEEIQRLGAQFFIASMEALGIIFLFAKISNYTIEQWSTGLTIVLYLLLVVLLLLIFLKKERIRMK